MSAHTTSSTQSNFWIALKSEHSRTPDRPPFIETLDSQLTAGLRLMLGVTLLVSSTDHTNAAPLPSVLAASLVVYVAYAAVAYAAALRGSVAADSLALFFPVDAGVFLLLTTLIDVDDHSLSYSMPYVFLFVVMCASLTWGTRAGQRVTMGIAGMFCVVMLLRTSIGRAWNGPGAVLRVISIIALGTMAARWGGYHFTLHRRLALLRDVGTLSNPRLGVDRMIATVLERLRTFCDAGICLLITKTPEEGTWRVYRSDEHGGEGGFQREELPAELEDSLEWLPGEALAVYAQRTPVRWRLGAPTGCLENWRHDGRFGNRQVSCQPNRVESWLARFGGRAWLSVPVFSGPRWIARLHMTGKRPLDPTEAEFVLQVIERGMLVIENMRLVDRLASTAAQRERQRIARDIHDSIIQPYIGLELGLTAVERTLRNGDAARALDEVTRLLGLTRTAIDDLRGHAGVLRSETVGPEEELMSALRRHVARFEEDSGIAIEVIGSEAVRCGDRLGAELFQMAVEALSNVRRHTTARRAAIRFVPAIEQVILQVENMEPVNGRPTAFVPKSISERAAALGGQVTVDQNIGGRTVVEIRVPR